MFCQYYTIDDKQTNMKIQKIFIGGWYQRTTLHLSEIYDFLQDAASPLALDRKKLRSLRDRLQPTSLEMRIRELEYICLKTKNGIETNIFEDGLIVLGKPVRKIEDDILAITEFHEKNLSPALNYLFSLGAPVPKELANIATVYPYFILLQNAKPTEINLLLKKLGQKKYFEIKKPEFEIYRGDKIYLINNIKEDDRVITRLINEQIFVREFKIQLHRYLNLHRIIWEKIAAIKERGEIRGREAGPLKTQLEGYSKTINLIDSRINQMNVYLGTREKIVKNDPQLKKITSIIEFKYETLNDTLSYVKELWVMTKNYVDSSLSLFAAIQAKSTEASIKNLTIITVTGVTATFLKLFSGDLPKFTTSGLVYFLILIFVGSSADAIIRIISRRKKYKIKEALINKDIN